MGVGVGFCVVVRRLYGLCMLGSARWRLVYVWFEIGLTAVRFWGFGAVFWDYVLLKWTLWNMIRFDISFDKLAENEAICLWMYIKNKSLAHLPSFFAGQ